MKRISVLFACLLPLLFAGCTATSSFDWLPLAHWDTKDMKGVQAQDVHIYYVSANKLEDAPVLFAESKQASRVKLQLKVLEETTHVKRTWMGDSQCYAYKMVLAKDSFERYKQLKAASGKVLFKLPHPEDGLSWEMLKMSKMLAVESADNAPSLEEWLKESNQ